METTNKYPIFPANIAAYANLSFGRIHFVYNRPRTDTVEEKDEWGFVSHVRSDNFLFGLLTDVRVIETAKGKQWVFLVKEGDSGDVAFSMPYDIQATKDILFCLPHLNLTEEVTIYTFLYKSTQKTHIRLFQDDTMVLSQPPQGLPQPTAKTTNGQPVWDYTNQMEFMETVIASLSFNHA